MGVLRPSGRQKVTSLRVKNRLGSYRAVGGSRYAIGASAFPGVDLVV